MRKKSVSKIKQPAPASAEASFAPASFNFPIVGIGASAGGLAALEAFFSALPAPTNPGISFILLQHLAPDQKSMLPELLKRCTSTRIVEVENGVTVEPNCAYIVPPNREMAFHRGTLTLSELKGPRGNHLPIDSFFRSLAEELQERAIGVILSGMGSDGSMGVKAIKGEGGMVMVQSPETTEYDSMPRSAIATGLVDYVLPPSEMPSKLMLFTTQAFGNEPSQAPAPLDGMEDSLKEILTLLRVQTGHDFSHYKHTTILRRIQRRMSIQGIESADEYVRALHHTPAEVHALFHELLIGVTYFFREPKTFDALGAEVIPKLFESKPVGGSVRVWVPACSTGEEAYSIAILLQEQM